MVDFCHYCKREFHKRDIPRRARFRHETYGGEPFFIYVLLCGSCARTLNHGAEVLEDGDPLELDQVTWQQGRLCDSKPEPAVKPEQMTLDQQGQLDLFKEGGS
jgi:hypothetical protein